MDGSQNHFVAVGKEKKRRNKEANNAWKSEIRTWVSKGATTAIIFSISLLSCFSFSLFLVQHGDSISSRAGKKPAGPRATMRHQT